MSRTGSGEKAAVFDIQRFSVHDGPGIRTLVFLKGCPLRCAWCSNPESHERTPELSLFPGRCIGCRRCVSACPQGAAEVDATGPTVDRALCRVCGRCAEACPSRARVILGRTMTVEEVFSEVEKDRVFYAESGGGVTVGGGEVTVWPKFAGTLLSRCRASGIGTAIETCGHSAWSRLWQVAQHADHVLYDVKHIDAAAHRQMTGATNAQILDNLVMLAKHHGGITIRIPVIPGFNDDPKTMQGIARYLARHDVTASVELLPYQNLGAPKYERLGKAYALAHLRPPDEDQLRELSEAIQAEGLMCSFRS